LRLVTYKSESLILLFKIAMTASRGFDRRIRVLFHSLGLSCIGGAIFLQVLVFTDIFQRGYFMAVEKNPTVLTFEVCLTAFALAYFLYIYQHLIRSIR
jgi:hypothetical protein